MVETGLIIDTHEDIQELVKSGMPEPQAETVVRQRVRLLESNLATKADIAATNARIEKLRLETEKLIALGKIDIIRWVVGANLGNRRDSRRCGQTPLITASSVSPALAGHPGGVRHGRAECRVMKTKLIGKASEDEA